MPTLWSWFSSLQYDYFDLDRIVPTHICFDVRWNDDQSGIKVVDLFGLVRFIMFVIKR